MSAILAELAKIADPIEKQLAASSYIVRLENELKEANGVIHHLLTAVELLVLGMRMVERAVPELSHKAFENLPDIEAKLASIRTLSSAP
jgi:hypothetical protein